MALGFVRGGDFKFVCEDTAEGVGELVNFGGCGYDNAGGGNCGFESGDDTVGGQGFDVSD